MPKKLTANTKAVEAKSRKEAASSEKKAKDAKVKEDAQWADEGPSGKAAKKKQEEERKRQEAAQKKAELERLKKLEESEMEKLSKKGVKGQKPEAGPKVTRAELDKQKEVEAKRKAEADKQNQKRASRVQDEADYARLVDVANTNRMEVMVDARNLNEAISQLSQVTLDEQAAQLDKHPEKRLRAAYKAYEEAELPRLRAETPGLTLTQYKEQIWKSWKKAPQNPLNQSPGR